ncbi:MAG: hypothetical protein ACSW8K_04250 [bacterium]
MYYIRKAGGSSSVMPQMLPKIPEILPFFPAAEGEKKKEKQKECRKQEILLPALLIMRGRDVCVL